MGEQFRITMSQRLICFDLYVIFSEQLAQFALLEERMTFDLIDRRQSGKLRNKGLPDLRCHIAYADRPQLALCLGFFQCFPCAGYIAIGLMQQIQIDVVRTEFVQ